jgi:hypothetical protein
VLWRILTPVLLLTSGAFGADVTGIWTGSMVDRNGDPQDFSFRFTQKAEALSGKMYGDNESFPLADANITGDHLTFSVTTELNGQISKFIYSGLVTGDRIELSRLRSEAKAPEKKVTDKPSEKPNPPQTFRLKRLT